MTMHIQIVNPVENNEDYKAKISIIEGQPEDEVIILKPGEVSQSICIYDGRSVTIEEVQD